VGGGAAACRRAGASGVPVDEAVAACDEALQVCLGVDRARLDDWMEACGWCVCAGVVGGQAA
jgi:hypothetical protein